MSVRHSLDNLCLEADFCLSNTRVQVGKPFRYQPCVASPVSTTMTIGTMENYGIEEKKGIWPNA
jgi:hypothetical protein